MLKHRILSGCVIGAGLVLAAQQLPSLGIWVLLLLISSLAQLEFYAMVRMAGIPVFKVVGLICGALLISATFFAIGPGDWALADAYQWEHFVMLGSLIAVFVRQFPQKHNTRPIETISCTLLGIWYVPYLFNFVTRLAFMWDGVASTVYVSETGQKLVLYLVVVVKSSDIGAYSVGRLIGRHKLFPRISPSKTWEGFFGGIGVSVIASWLFLLVGGGRIGNVTLRGVDAVVLGVLLSVTGVAGDMFESLIKRASGAKDSSATIPGMGGILDVLDSLLFGAPVLYVYARLFLQG